jgi:hypothetical protein
MTLEQFWNLIATSARFTLLLTDYGKPRIFDANRSCSQHGEETL